MPSLAQLPVIVKQDLLGKSSKTEREWLESRQIVILWFEELQTLRNDLIRQIADRAILLQPLKPQLGTHASQEYLDALAIFREWRQRTVYLKSKAEDRIKDAKRLIRMYDIDMPKPLLINKLLVIRQMTEQDKDSEVILDEIFDKISDFIERWSLDQKPAA